MSFDRPQVLIGFLGFIPFMMLSIAHYRTHRPFLDFLVSPLLRDTLIRELKLRYLLSSVCFGIFLAGTLLALAGPRWGRKIVMDYHRGIDLVLALDLSRSMDIRDHSPEDLGEDSRLDRAIHIALSTAEASEGIRFGAAIGKGRGVLAVPLTYDRETLLHFLEGLSTEAITGKGTNLETLVDAAAGAFQNSAPTRRGIILFSDGESWSGTLSAALDRAIAAGITLTAVGVGTETGGSLPQEPEILSYRREEVLRNMAERTGGIYIDGNQRDAAELLAAQIRSLSPASGIRGSHLEVQAQWRLFLLCALAGLGASKALEKKRRNPHG